MSNESSITLFTRGALMLQEANTIQKAKELKDMALTAADWAKRRQLGEDTIDIARGYALEAERKMGEMLRDTDRAKGGNPNLPTSNHRAPVGKTLAEIGLSKKDSAKAQAIAALPREVFEAVKAGTKTRAAATKKPPVQSPLSKIKVRLEPPPDEPEPKDQKPDFQAEFLRTEKEKSVLEKLVVSLQKNDLAKEVTTWKGKFDSVCGRVNQLLTTEAAITKTATYRGTLLASIRKELGVEKDSEILPAIKAIKK